MSVDNIEQFERPYVSAAEQTFVELLTLKDIEALPPPTYLVDKLLTDTGLALMYGQYASGKSFVALDIGLHVAFGRRWQGRETKAGKVVYIAGEGVSGLKKRIAAWRKHYDFQSRDAPFVVIREHMPLLNSERVNGLVETLKEQGEVTLVIIDTLARAFTGGDENSSTDMGNFVRSCERIRETTGGAVLIVHHTGKDRKQGARGSTALMGAVDTAITIEKTGNTMELTVAKQKDDEPGLPFGLMLLELDVEDPQSHETSTSCVVVKWKLPKKGNDKKGPRLSEKQQAVLNLLHDAGETGLTNLDWRKRCEDVGIGHEATFYNIKKKLLDDDLAIPEGKKYYHREHHRDSHYPTTGS